MSLILKDPGAALDYEIDWGADYLDGDDRIASSLWQIEPDEPGGASVVASSFTESIATVTVGGGFEGRVYRLANSVATAAGRSDRRSIMLRVEKR